MGKRAEAEIEVQLMHVKAWRRRVDHVGWFYSRKRQQYLKFGHPHSVKENSNRLLFKAR
jgi:hypothetical protein